MKEHRKRIEIKESRKKVEEAKISFQREVEKYHAKIKEDEEEIA
jgi:hypothetical protein